MLTPDLTTHRIVHRCLRRASGRLAAAASGLDATDGRRVRAFAAYWRGFAGEVSQHHRVEDRLLFPALVDQLAVGAEALRAAERDHDRLDHLLAVVEAEVALVLEGAGPEPLARALDELAGRLCAHLDLEDADLLPLFERHFTGDEYAELHSRAVRSLTPGRQAAFTVPFVLDGCTPAERMKLIVNAPLAFRTLYALTRRHHSRLAATALGADAPVTVPWAVAL